MVRPRPSGIEDVYKRYAESFLEKDHLRRMQEEAQALVAKALAAVKWLPIAPCRCLTHAENFQSMRYRKV